MSAPFASVAIVGVGLIGGSLGLAIKRRYPNIEVIGVDRTERIVKSAQARGAIDTGSTDLSQGVGRADVIFVATPVRIIAELLPTLGPLIRPDALVTDVGSTKARICQIAERFFPSRFIGGHPMTGSERQGVEAADPLLFENALYVLTPLSASTEQLERLRQFLEGVGARVLCLEPERHDRIVAYVSHLPQLLAVALAGVVAQRSQEDALYTELAAGGFPKRHPPKFERLPEAAASSCSERSGSARGLSALRHRDCSRGDEHQGHRAGKSSRERRRHVSSVL